MMLTSLKGRRASDSAGALRLEGGILADHLPEGGFDRHISACNNARLPGERVPFRIGSDQVGWVTPVIVEGLGRASAVNRDSDGVTLKVPEALPAIARGLADQGLFRWRGEEFDVRASPEGPSLARIDRGAIPSFGIQAAGVHVNGLVRRPDGLQVWVARRAKDKQLDPGKLDHIVAGGVPAGLSPRQTLIKEAGEEASIPLVLAAEAIEVGRLQYGMERPEGLRRDYVYCYDLILPPDFLPVAADGEVEGFELWPIERVAETVRQTDEFKFNVNLVLIDLFIRCGLITGSPAKRLSDTLRIVGEPS
jgi:8-oxo-dGTP pyrophosphatase MutT (NUDIX family)